MSKWVMTERKVIVVEEPVVGSPYDHPNTRTVTRIFAVGDDAPPGHEGRPYTRMVSPPYAGDEPPFPGVDGRIEPPGPNRMLDTTGAKKRGRPRRAQP